ncbi:MAG: T9SS type A sorting domain-containing protein [Paludibacter sp.]|nr:T9SS type A sorting domain-containing protein [Paludibacter sp.]
MKTINIVLITLLCFVFQAKAQTVEFSYDLDGNMEERKILIVGPQTVKASSVVPETITEELGEQKISIYPNPTKGMFQVEVKLLDTNLKNYLRLYSLSGANILEMKIESEFTNIDISKYPTGAYLMDLYLGDKVSKWKVIKK